MPFAIDRRGRPVYPTAPFGFGPAMQAPYTSYDGYGQPDDAVGGAHPLQTWSGNTPQAVNVDDGASSPGWRSGGFTPVPMFPDVFGPWRKFALGGLAGLLHASRPWSNMSGMGADDPACHDEWAKAWDWCDKELEKPRPERAVGYRNIEDCARGLVSARCGGNNLIDMPQEPPPEKPPSDPDKRDSDSDKPDDAKERDEKDIDCDEERADARRKCAAEFATGKPRDSFTGGYRNIEDCVRGHVSEYCGGGAVEPPPPPVRVKRYDLRPRRKR
jgi:hypothetical protein